MRPAHGNSPHAAFLVSAMATLLSGCAVMRVDVDVYKGPLADEEHVQIQRLAVMAIGARPLLISARNQLATGHLKEQFQGFGYSSQDVFETPAGQEEIWKGNRDAKLINDVLALYEDRNGDPKLEPYAGHARKTLDHLAIVLNHVSPDVELFANRLSNFSEAGPKSRNQSAEYARTRETLLSGSGRDRLETILKGDDVQLLQISPQFEPSDAAPSNLSGLRIALDSTFPQPLQDSRRELTAQLKQALRYAREFNRTMFGALVDLDDGGNSFSSADKSLRWKIAVTTVPVLNLKEADAALAEIKEDCEIGFYKVQDDVKLSGYYAEIGQRVVRKMYCHPGLAGTALLSYDLKQFRLREIGLERLPTATAKGKDAVSASAKMMTSLFDRKFSSQSNDFSAGRVDDGLTTLIEEQLKSGHASNKTEELERRRQLADALIQFAQKMLFATNNMIFVAGDRGTECDGASRESGGNDSCDFAQILEVVGNSILVQANELHARGQHESELARRGAARREAIKAAFSGSPAETVRSIVSRTATRRAELEKSLEQGSRLVAAEAEAKTAVSNAEQSRKTADKELETKKAALATSDARLAALVMALDGLADHRFVDCMAVAAGAPLPSEGAQFKKGEGCADQVRGAAEKAGEPDRVKRMIALKSELQARITSSSVESFRSALASDRDAASSTVKGTKSAVDVADAALASAKATETIKADEMKSAKTAAEKYKVANAEAYSLSARYAPGVTLLLRKTSQDVLRSENVNAENLMSLWIAAIEDSGDENRAEALRLLESTPAPLVAPPELLAPGPAYCDGEQDCITCVDDSCKPDAIEAMDALIAWLQTNRLRILNDYGENSDAYRSAASAIKEAHLDRAGLSYIRPAASYLRSSYTASSLQQGQGTEWDNLLKTSYNRGIPYFGEWFYADPRREVLDALDKQFWQNINTVRVSGGGLSNYVLVKDDVGNWTVRSFSTNYKQLLKSLSGMALFNYGEQLNASLALNDGTPRAIGEARLSPKSSGMGGLFASYRDAFSGERLKAHQSLASELKSPGMASVIKTAWDADPVVKEAGKLADAKKQIDGFYAAHLEEAAKTIADAKDPDGFELIYAGLRALQSFKKELPSVSATFTAETEPELKAATAALAAANARLESDPEKPAVVAAATSGFNTAKEKHDAARAAAVQAVSLAIGKVTPLIKAVSANRDASIREYERALAFIGEAANRDVTPDPAVPAK